MAAIPPACTSPPWAKAAGLARAAVVNAATVTKSLWRRRIGESSFRTCGCGLRENGSLVLLVSNGGGDVDGGEQGEDHGLHQRDKHAHHQEGHRDQEGDEGEEDRADL